MSLCCALLLLGRSCYRFYNIGLTVNDLKESVSTVEKLQAGWFGCCTMHSHTNITQMVDGAHGGGGEDDWSPSISPPNLSPTSWSPSWSPDLSPDTSPKKVNGHGDDDDDPWDLHGNAKKISEFMIMANGGKSRTLPKPRKNPPPCGAEASPVHSEHQNGGSVDYNADTLPNPKKYLFSSGAMMMNGDQLRKCKSLPSSIGRVSICNNKKWMKIWTFIFQQIICDIELCVLHLGRVCTF